jgi:hypothetical protein
MEDLIAIGETGGAVAVEMAVSAMLETGGKVGPCTNCSAPMMGNFCGVCGQPVETHRRSVFVLLHDLFKDVASFDSRILRTARALLFQPGELPLAFRQGRTQRYVPAVRLYLFVSLIFFLALSLFGIAIMQLTLADTTQQYVTDKNHDVFLVKNGVRSRMAGLKSDDQGHVYVAQLGKVKAVVANMKVNGDKSVMISTVPHFFTRIGTLQSQRNSKALSEALGELDKNRDAKPGFALWLNEHVARMFKALANDPASINGPLTAWMPRALIILLPLFALLLALFYWRQRKKFYFVDHLVFSLSFHTFVFAWLLVAAGLAQILPGAVVATFGSLVLGLYLLLAMKKFYGQGWFWTGAKFATIAFFYVTTFVLPALATIIVLSMLYG